MLILLLYAYSHGVSMTNYYLPLLKYNTPKYTAMYTYIVSTNGLPRILFF